jgi:hypothetical protein
MNMKFSDFLEAKLPDTIRWPADCDMKRIERKATNDTCYVEPGGSHDKVKKRTTKTTVTVVPRHKSINSFTCKGIIRDIKQGCFPAEPVEPDESSK